MKQTLLVLCSAIVGGVLGYFAFFWLFAHGFYGMILPGGLLGLGASIPRNRHRWLAVVCGLLATGLGLFTEWRLAPFVKDESLGDFLLHVHHKGPVTLLMIAAGGVLGFWLPYSRLEDGSRPGKRPEGPPTRPD
jgi:uncharacterized membrane protein YqgA involved in biofilm formation